MFHLKRYFDRTAAKPRQLLHRGRFASEKRLSGGRSQWCYWSTAAVRRRIFAGGGGLRPVGQGGLLDRPRLSHHQQILASDEQKHCHLPQYVEHR